MISHKQRIVLVALCVLVSGAKAWEIPSFLLDSLPQLDQSTTNGVRLLQNSTTNETIYNDQGSLDEPIVGDQGTATPTESPAPSPSPSDTPTIAPTITGNPTSKPTSSPTESPAPSPSPTEIPSAAPSGAPSIPPSENPTVSSPPSIMPTVAPSDYPTTLPSVGPSMSPTISSPPSLSPSHAPSDTPTSVPSVLPSSSPTLVDEVMGEFTVSLSIETGELDETQIKALEDATVGFLSKDAALEDGKLSELVVQFVGQVVIDVSNANNTASKNMTRSLFDSLSLQQKLVIDFSVYAIYSGPESLFNLNAAVDPFFQDPTSRWYTWLSTADTVFAPLSPEPPTPEQDNSIESDSSPNAATGVRGGTIAIVTILAVASLAVGIAASIYSIRQYRRNLYGQELNDVDDLGTFSRDELVEIQQFSHQEKEPEPVVPKARNPLLSRSASADDTSAQSWMKPPNSPNSLEMGKAVHIQEIMKKNPISFEDKRKDEVMKRKSERRIDPPTANTVAAINVPNTVTNERKFQDPRQIGSLLDTNTEISDMTRSQMAGHEIMLTKSNGGTLGAKPGSVANSGFTASDFSDHAKSFFEQGEKKKSSTGLDRTTSTTIAHPTPLVGAHLRSYDSGTTGGGLYDVFAPPGPIGIVVDTTKDGPAVHSLKRTSPMLGLINAGDLIIALDDVDTRGMTAATLTQLMAKKATQKERKITLLTVDNL